MLMSQCTTSTPTKEVLGGLLFTRLKKERQKLAYAQTYDRLYEEDAAASSTGGERKEGGTILPTFA